MSEKTAAMPTDPRIRRTRRLLQAALETLLTEKSFDTISITDICKQADVARITFYQHYESKEGLLLACVDDFFVHLYQSVDQEALARFFETGEAEGFMLTRQVGAAEPERVRLIGVALAHVGTAVRQLTIQSFLETYSQRETGLSQKGLEVLATFYVGGMLALLEQFLNGRLNISQAEFQATTLTTLQLLRQDGIRSAILPAFE